MYFGISQFSQRLNTLPEADASRDAADMNDVNVSEKCYKSLLDCVRPRRN